MFRYINLFTLSFFAFGEIAAQAGKEKTLADLKQDITYLSSDALEGRLTGSPGERASAEYIAAEFAKAGLKPLNKNWYQTFEITKLRLATNKCKLSFGMNEHSTPPWTLHSDYYPMSESSNKDSVTAEILDAGYGLVIDSLRDDYAGLGETKGKIFVIRLGFPGDLENPHSPLEAGADIFTKIRAAIAHGAAGIIFIPGSDAAEVPKGELKPNGTVYKLPIFYSTKMVPTGHMFYATMISEIAAPKATAHNVMGFRNNRKKNTIIICAHHDHIGHNEYNNSTYRGKPLNGNAGIHNGADDNASGVAAMLELARLLKGKDFKKNNYLFIAFSGEELGLIGSKFFTHNPAIPLGKLNYVINIDMLGRLDSHQRTLIINGTGTSPAWTNTLNVMHADTNKVKIKTSASGLGASDHSSFYLENIPVLHFFTGQHMDYHKPSDDEEKINYVGMYNSIQVIRHFLVVNNGKKKLAFAKTKDIEMGKTRFRVTLGIMPDYAFNGEGLRIDGVTDGKPASMAGLIRGDVIINFHGEQIYNIEDYMAVLGKFAKGDKTTLTLKRGAETLIREISF